MTGGATAARGGPAVGLARGELAACPACLRRTRLVELLSPHIERARHDGERLPALLALPDEALLDALAGGRRGALEAELDHFVPAAAARRCRAAGVAAVCRHDGRYPPRLLEAADAPAVLHVAGEPATLARLAAVDGTGAAVAVVGARRATPYGREVAYALGRSLAAAGVVVVSGMALGVDAAAHEGALAAGGPTLAVLAGAPELPYPATKRALHASIVAHHCAVSELPPGTRPRRWCFPARNRIIAALGGVIVIVEAAERSGSLITADIALQLGRVVAAVPGPVTAPQSVGTNGLLHDGAPVVRDARDVLDLALGAGAHLEGVDEGGREGCEGCESTGEPASRLPEDLERVLALVDAGHATPGALAARTGGVSAAIIALTRLELLGLLRREGDGRYARRLR
ncbi:MAG: DNA-processing protein DprA [Actinomycetota bacterium]|nr:DNA-processing protein DprA [Actinomycetota bacterium]